MQASDNKREQFAVSPIYECASSFQNQPVASMLDTIKAVHETVCCINLNEQFTQQIQLQEKLSHHSVGWTVCPEIPPYGLEPPVMGFS